MPVSTPDDPRGDCFKAAFDHLVDIGAADLDGEKFILVHGNLAHLPQDTEVNHAWVEEGDTVHEVSNGLNKRIPKDKYYADFQVKNIRRYTLIEAFKLNGGVHYGPWN